jgi:pantetheine-phosphate adenylyltransferase
MKRIIFPGTFDPIHYGHIDIARRSLKLFDELVIAVYDKPLKNLLFSPQERITLTLEEFKNDARVKVEGYSGLTISYARTRGACAILRGLRVFSDFEYEFRMALANKRLDPDIEVVALNTGEQHTILSTTTVKEIAALGGDVSSMVPPHVATAMQKKFLELGDGQNVVPLTSMRD